MCYRYVGDVLVVSATSGRSGWVGGGGGDGGGEGGGGGGLARRRAIVDIQAWDGGGRVDGCAVACIVVQRTTIQKNLACPTCFVHPHEDG